MKEGDQTSVYLDSNFKPPDRSTSAPPVLSLHSESLFAFRASEHLQLFSDIRSAYEDEEHMLNSLNPSSSHQQTIQQLQQQIQQQKAQIQQQALQHLQLQQQQQFIQQQQLHSPHHSSLPQHLQQPQPHPHQQHIMQPHPQQQQQPHIQNVQHLPHHQQPQQQLQYHAQHPAQSHIHHPLPNQHQLHLQQLQHQQPHMRFSERSASVPDALNPLPRSLSNPSYSMRAQHDRFDTVREEPSHLSDEVDLTDSPGHGIWGYSRSGGLADYRADTDHMHSNNNMAQQQQARHPSHNLPHRTPPLQQSVVPQSRDPSMYYNNQDYDNVAYSTANHALKDDLGSIWEPGYDSRAVQQQQPTIQQQRKQSTHHLPAPTPQPSVGALDHLLGGGFPNRRRSGSGGNMAGGSVNLPNNIVPTTSPPLMNSGSSSTSPALTVCRYFAQGFCSRGDKCSFLHDEQQQLAYQQDRAADQFAVNKPKVQPQLKKVASPPPISMSNREPSPVGNNIRGLPHSMSNGNSGNHPNGPNSVQNPNSLSNIISALSSMNMSESGSGRSSGRLSPNGMIDMIGNGNTSPQPRTGTPNGLADAFANGGSTSPNSKSDLSRQYTSIEQVIGHIYSLCKDQHGCRFLQKKLEDRDSMIVEIIFNEVYDHMTELMIDPFGNYLCQKLLEHCNDEQRLHIIEKVAPDLVKISKNMHGTRAVQKMIEYLTTPEQVGVASNMIAIAKKALSNHVVTLIQDLNGNHVIQRCLNRLSPQDNQFIYDSVSQAGHCVEVATHRHGCCVLQRCIDHASDSQKIQLINEIIANALVLVQDPYGNYVVQYVLDLPFPGLASRLARRFLGHIPILSTQKFSSNVVEKCLNVTDIQTRAAIIQELVEYDNLLYLLQDPYANYVIQTSLNVSEPVQHARLVEAIRPHLTSLRNTPYGKRIQNKILKESSRDYYA